MRRRLPYHERKETWSEDNPDGRFRKFSMDDILKRDKTSLDTKTLSKDEKITKKDIHMIEEAKKHPIVFDEDSPELTPEMEKAFLLAAKNRNRLKA